MPPLESVDASRTSLNVNAPTFTPSNPQSNGGNILNQLLPHQNTSIVPNGEVMVSSGKYSGPTQPHGKSYFKDEVFIRNADSGKGTYELHDRTFCNLVTKVFIQLLMCPINCKYCRF